MLRAFFLGQSGSGPALLDTRVGLCRMERSRNISHEWLVPPLFKNCTNRYPHGVGRLGARDDHTSGTPVTNFRRSTLDLSPHTPYDPTKGVVRDRAPSMSKCPRQESNLRAEVRDPLLYPSELRGQLDRPRTGLDRRFWPILDFPLQMSIIGKEHALQNTLPWGSDCRCIITCLPARFRSYMKGLLLGLGELVTVIGKRFVFLHVPKTGGTWATEAMAAAGVEFTSAGMHANLQAVRSATLTSISPSSVSLSVGIGHGGLIVILFVIENDELLNPFGHAPFEVFLAMATNNYQGTVSSLFEQFTGPSNTFHSLYR